jgi:carbonic anhydrase/acetyltransferase-like protein (isoleucine patch superfamily)
MQPQQRQYITKGGPVIESFDGKTPRVAESAFVHPSAHVIGDVEIGDCSIVLPGAIVRGDVGSITIGKHVFIEDNCVLHVGTHEDRKQGIRTPLDIGDSVTMGHGAVVHGRRIGDRALIGMNATILQNVEIGDSCVIAAGSVVPERMNIPSKSFVAGVPAKIKGGLKKEHLIWVEGNQDWLAPDKIQKLRESTAYK